MAISPLSGARRDRIYHHHLGTVGLSFADEAPQMLVGRDRIGPPDQDRSCLVDVHRIHRRTPAGGVCQAGISSRTADVGVVATGAQEIEQSLPGPADALEIADRPSAQIGPDRLGLTRTLWADPAKGGE